MFKKSIAVKSIQKYVKTDDENNLIDVIITIKANNNIDSNVLSNLEHQLKNITVLNYKNVQK